MEAIMTPMQPILETLRLNLRPVQKADAGLISLYSSDFRVARMTTRIPQPNPPGAVELFIEQTQKEIEVGGITWAVDGTPGFGTPLVGMISLGKDGELGYWIAPFFWGLGIATEAAKCVAGYARSRGDARVWAGAFCDNPASQNVLRKAGLMACGDRELFSVARNETVKSLLFERRFEDGQD